MVRIGKEMEKQVLPRTGAHTTLMRGATLSWLYRPRYRRSKRTSLLD